MNFKSIAIIGLLFFFAAPIFPAMGADLSTYSNEKLASMRGTMRDAPAEERAAFRNEWNNRIQSMTAEERQKYAGRPENAPQGGYGMNRKRGDHGDGYRKNYRRRHGSGGGR